MRTLIALFVLATVCGCGGDSPNANETEKIPKGPEKMTNPPMGGVPKK